MSESILHLHQPLSPQERTPIQALEWLGFESCQKQDGLFKCNQLIRRFLTLGKINAAAQVQPTFPHLLDQSWLQSLEQLSVQDVHGNILRNAAHEQICYRQLISCIQGYYDWKQLFDKGSKMVKNSREFKNWCLDLRVFSFYNSLYIY